MSVKRSVRILAVASGILLVACGTATTEPSAMVTTEPSATVASASEASTAVAPLAATTIPANGETTVPTIDLAAPTQVVDTFLARVRDQQYTEVEPLMTDLLRDAFVQGAGSVEAGFRMTDERDGKLVSYRLGTARATSETSATVDVELESERVTTVNIIEVVNENGTWKVANITTH